MISENIYSVLQINSRIKSLVENDTLFRLPINVRGELSGYKLSSTGSIYFTLKDSTSKISCALFKNSLNYELLQFKDGDQVIINGVISVWDKTGTYVVTVKTMKKEGLGQLYEKYEKLKKEYFDKGYFDDIHKKPIPLFPKIIGVCTSPTGAVRHDIETTLNKRFPLVKMIMFPCTVQGSDAAKSIVDAIKRANDYK
jgi:exodeoxyribonuclease VII large subunit